MSEREATARLRRAIENRTLVPFVGAGVSHAVATLPLWPGIAESACAYLDKSLNRLDVDKRRIQGIRRDIEADLMSAIDKIQRILSRDGQPHYESPEYAAWLEETFSTPENVDTGLLFRLARFGARVMVTTNYDLLLEEYVNPGAVSVTWETPHEMRAVIRGGTGIVHLHGRFDRPRSVILSDSDYTRVVLDETASAVCQTLFEAGLLLFVGVSVDGASDPHLDQLLRYFRRLTDETLAEPEPHIFLHCETLTAHDRVKLRQLGIEPIRYGSDYRDLETYLTRLSSREQVKLKAADTRECVSQILRAEDYPGAVRAGAEIIRRWVYAGRDIRVSYANYQKRQLGDAATTGSLVERYVYSGKVPSEFSYPLSMPGWAVAEGRAIAWPTEQARACDLDRLRKMNRFATLRKMISDEIPTISEPDDKAALELMLELFDSGTLMLDHLVDDWPRVRDDVLIQQTLSVPVVLIDSVGNAGELPLVGVYNIDTIDEGLPLATPDTLARLQILMELLYARYRFADSES